MATRIMYLTKGWIHLFFSLFTFCRFSPSDSHEDRGKMSDVKASYLVAAKAAVKEGRRYFSPTLGEKFDALLDSIADDYIRCENAETFRQSVVYRIQHAGLQHNVPGHIVQLFEARIGRMK
jgi:hypothetical protein